MKIVKLEPDRVRVFISEGDLSDMKIDIDAITPDSPVLSVFLCHILEAVKEETGFSASDGQIIAEATPKPGGIILDLSHSKKEKACNEAKCMKKDSIMFEITDFDCLSEMLKNIPPTYLLGMRLYTYGNNFYVAVPKRRIPALIYEYSLKNRKSTVAESKIAEYGQLVAGGYRLISMASMLKKIN